jgi:hypothetical protein
MNDTVPSSKRAEANRRNAQKSTGPRTAAGKERARFNAVKHGMRAKTIVLPGEDPEAYQARMVAWTNDLNPGNDVERFLVCRAVQLSWQLERADRALAAQAADARSAGANRVDDLSDEVAALGRRLLWDPRGPTFFYPQFEITLGDPKRVSWSGLIDDPDDPVRLINRLESTALGCAWLLDRWGELRDVLEAGRNWEPRDRFKAIRLLGRQPLDIEDDARVLSIYAWCTAMDTSGLIALKDLTNELHWNEQKRLADWITRRWAEPEDRPDAETAKAALLALVSEEEGRLEDALASHLQRHEASAGAALEFDASDEGERLRRYQATCDRALMRVLDALRKRRRDAEGATAGPRRPARPAANETPDPLRGIAGLLNLVAAARGAAATTETPRPAVATIDQPSPVPSEPPSAEAPLAVGNCDPPAGPSTGAGSALRLAPSETTSPDPEDRDHSATNEANEPRRNAGRRTSAMAVAILTVLALLVFAGLAAAFGASKAPHPLFASHRPDAVHAPAQVSHPDRTDQSIRDEPGRPAPAHIRAFP